MKKVEMWLFVWLGREEIVEILVKNGAYVNLKNKNDKTALDIAVEKGTSLSQFASTKRNKMNLNYFWPGFGKIVEILIQNGANAKLANRDGKTPLDIAVERGNENNFNKTQKI